MPLKISTQRIIRTLTFSPDGGKIACGTMGGDVQMLDVEAGIALTSFFEEESPIDNSYQDPIVDVVFASDGSPLARRHYEASPFVGET